MTELDKYIYKHYKVATANGNTIVTEHPTLLARVCHLSQKILFCHDSGRSFECYRKGNRFTENYSWVSSKSRVFEVS